MKKLNFLFVLIGVLSLGFFNSCTEDEDPAEPTITITVDPENEATYEPGSYVDFEVAISSNAELVSFKVDAGAISSDPADTVIATTPADVLEKVTDGWEFANNYTSVTVTYRFYIAEALAAGTTINLTFEIEDKDAIGTRTESFDVVAAAATYERFTAILMGAQNNLTDGSFLDASEGTVMLKTDADANQALVDIVYYYGSTNEATLCAPNDETVGGGAGNLALCEGWTTMNATVFGATNVTATEFDAIDDDSFTADIDGLSETKVTTLAEGGLFAFQTVDGDKGLVKVVAITAGADGQIEIEVVIEK